jgi:hypothetical protein
MGPGAGPGAKQAPNQFASPAQPVQDPGAKALMDSVRDILAATRIIAQRVPQAQPEVQEIMANVQRMMGKILGNQAPTEAQAPPL